MREGLTRERLRALMDALAKSAPSGIAIRAYFIGGATAIDHHWRLSTIDADLHASDDRLFAQIQRIKERLRINVEWVRPEDFVPPLSGSENRHIFIDTLGLVSFFHYDPYAQLLSKIVRGFRRDVEDATRFVDDGLVEIEPGLSTFSAEQLPGKNMRIPTEPDRCRSWLARTTTSGCLSSFSPGKSS